MNSKRLIFGALTALAFGVVAGCSIFTTNHGELGLRFGTDIAVYHTASDTSSTAKSGVESQLFEDYVRNQTQESGTPDTNSNGV